MNRNHIFVEYVGEKNEIETILPNIISNKNYHFETDKHPNQIGYEVIARNIFEDLKDQKFLPCN